MNDIPAVEGAIIGCILLDSKKIMQVIIERGVKEEWFSHKKTRTLFSTCVNMYGTGKVIDNITLTEYMLKGVPELKKNRVRVNITDVLCDFIDSVTTVAYIESYCSDLEYIYKKSATRELLETSLTLIEKDSSDLTDILNRIQTGVTSIVQGNEDDSRSIYDAVDEEIEKWQETSSGRRITTSVAWPVGMIDKVIPPLEDELIWLIGGASIGKTAFCLQMMVNSAKKGIKTSLRSLESKKNKLAPRLIGQIAEVNTLRLRMGRGFAHDLEKCTKASEYIRTLDLSISDASASLEQLYVWGQKEKTKGSKLLIIDNTRHIRMHGKYRSPVEQMRELSIRLKWMRDDIGLPMMVLHHANADGDISWSKDIRNDADIMIFIRKDEEQSIPPSVENNFNGQDYVIFDINKNRDGITPAIGAKFVKQFQKFEDTDEETDTKGSEPPI